MPAGRELNHQGRRGLGAAAGTLGSVVLLAATPSAAQAGLLAPLLSLMRPQLELRITAACQQWAAAGDKGLEERMGPPCRALAGPTSRCLVDETERSGRGLGVMSELLAGRFGDDSEVVVKRCAGRLLGLPPDSFQDVPIRELAKRFKAAAPAPAPVP
ncbi:MAG: hypothetical protein RLZZ589_1874 [Cyanobacteriota bacterium]